MWPRRFASVSLLLGLAVIVTGCPARRLPYDYSNFRSHFPRSILVLPPINDTVEVDATYDYLSTITQPLAEAGYYVFPVAVVDHFMKENGLPTPTEMNAVPLDKLRDIFGTDSILYVHIEEWGQKYRVLASITTIKAHARLVDAHTGTMIWEGTIQVAQGSSDSSGGPVGMLIAAAVEQVVGTAIDQPHRLCAAANCQMVLNPTNGILAGPYSPNYGSDTRGR